MKAEDTITKSTVAIEILTPTHIGGASENHWQQGIDFISENGKVWILDFKKLSTAVPIENLTLAFARSDQNITLEKLLQNKNPNQLSAKSFDFSGVSREIKRHIFNGLDGLPYIPGSSLKGAVASVLLNFFFKQLKIKPEKKDPTYELLGSFDTSIMRFLQFTDGYFDDSRLFNTKIFNLFKHNDNNWEGGWKHSSRTGTNQDFNDKEFTTIYECLPPGQTTEMMISFKKNVAAQLYKMDSTQPLIKTPPAHTQKWITNNPVKELINIINDHTRSYLEKEIAFFEEYKFDARSKSALNKLASLLHSVNQLNPDKECILRLAAGSGFHSITGDWQFDDHINTGEHTSGKRKYKSRKLAFEGTDCQTMGFIKLTFLSEEDIVNREAGKLKKRKEALIIAQQEEEERILKEKEEELARIEASKPKIFEGNLKPGVIIDAEVVRVTDNKVTLKLYALNQTNNEREIRYHGLTVGKILIVQVKNVAKNGFIVAVEFKGFK